jgi:hypothetical protein
MKVSLADMEYQISQHCPSVTRAIAEAVVPIDSDVAVLAVFCIMEMYYQLPM